MDELLQAEHWASTAWAAHRLKQVLGLYVDI